MSKRKKQRFYSTTIISTIKPTIAMFTSTKRIFALSVALVYVYVHPTINLQ